MLKDKTKENITNKEKRRQKSFLIATILWIIFIWFHSLIQGEQSTIESSFCMDIVNSFLSKLGFKGYRTLFLFRKTAHFTEYFILGILVANLREVYAKNINIKIYLPPIMGLIIATIDETIQLFVPGRIGNPIDVCIDFAGVCVGVALSSIIIYNKRSKNSGNNN